MYKTPTFDHGSFNTVDKHRHFRTSSATTTSTGVASHWEVSYNYNMSTHSNPFAPWMCQFQSISSLGHNSHYASPGYDNRNKSPYTSYAEPPSILGVLPMSTSHSHSHSHSHSPFSHSSSTSHHIFEFTNLNPTILNSVVTATSATRPAFRISTDKGGGVAGYTTVKDGEGRSVALIEWAGSAVPSVEIRGVLPKVKARDWLKVTVEPSLGR